MMGERMEINQQAPVSVSREVVIAAAPESVWAVHTDIDSWPTWHADISEAVLQGPLEQGSTFRWRSGPGTIASTLQVVEPPVSIAWTGKALGTRAIHVWRFEPVGGGTRVVTQESMEGWPVKMARGFFDKTLRRSLDSWLTELKAKLEGDPD